jgi:hypothetical protein
MRGGGPGADIGNRGEAVLMHEGSRPYWRTPGIIERVGQSDADPARPARRVSQAP